MRLTLDHLSAIAGGTINAARRSNMASIIAGLAAMGATVGLDRPQRLAQYLAQLAHESGRFVYDREVWGPTPAQARYDTRTDLGNTAERDGDGKLYMGRSGIQVTGRSNYEQFRDWCWANGLPAPDFVADPDAVNTDPWEGLAPIWYWSTRSLNRYADANDIEMVTRRINGGLNGFADRLAMFTRVALVLLGRKIEARAIERFQRDHGLIADDIAGPKTRAAIHAALGNLPAVTFAETGEAAAPVTIVPAEPSPPIVVPVPAEPKPALPHPPMTEDEYLVLAETALALRRRYYGA